MSINHRARNAASRRIVVDDVAVAADEDIVVTPLTELIDSDTFTPRLLALLSNALVWRESTLLRRECNLGTNDWRVISVLAMRPGSSATEISDFVAMNKAVVSKAVNTLVDRHLVVAKEGPRGSRPLYLTKAGAETHDLMLPISLEGEKILLGDLTGPEVRQLTTLLTRLTQKMPELDPLS